MACSDSSILSTGLQNGLLTGLLTSPAMCLLLIGPLLTILPDHHDELNIRTDDVRIYTANVDNTCHPVWVLPLKNLVVSQKFQWTINFSYDVRLSFRSRHWIKNDDIFDLRLVLLPFHEFENLAF